MTYENYINDGAQYVCPDCAPGYYDFKHECKECKLTGCVDCSSENVCVECEEGKWMRVDQKGCIVPIDKCVGPEYVAIVGGNPICLNCT